MGKCAPLCTCIWSPELVSVCLPYLVFWARIPSELRAGSLRLAGQQTPGILLSLPPSMGIADVCLLPGFYRGPGEQVPMLLWQAFYCWAISSAWNVFFLFLLCVFVCLSVCMGTTCRQCSRRPKQGIRSLYRRPWAAPGGCWELNPGLLEEYQVIYYWTISLVSFEMCSSMNWTYILLKVS